jgi:hypothetical protein
MRLLLVNAFKCGLRAQIERPKSIRFMSAIVNTYEIGHYLQLILPDFCIQTQNMEKLIQLKQNRF